MNKLVAALLVVFSIGSAHAQARILAGLTGSNITIANTDAADIQILGLKVTSPGGGLHVENAFPLSNILFDSPKEAIVANDGDPFTLTPEMTVATGITFSRGPESIGELCLAIAGGGRDYRDFNGDGEVDSTDLNCVIRLSDRDFVLTRLNTLPGDLDGNGDVSFKDFLTLSVNFARDLPTYTDGNIDLQNGVDFADFLVLSTNFEMTPNGMAAVPEPHSIVAIGLTLLGMAPLRRRQPR